MAALEQRIGSAVRLVMPSIPWMVRHAGYLITRCRVSPSGRTFYQIMKGGKSNAKHVELGEVVHFKTLHTQFKIGKFEDYRGEAIPF